MITVKPITNEELRQRMKEGKVTFQYRKNDGTIRQAVGTLNPKFVTRPSNGGPNKVKDAGYSTYFDVEKDAFRCYAESKLVGVVES